MIDHIYYAVDDNWVLQNPHQAARELERLHQRCGEYESTRWLVEQLAQERGRLLIEMTYDLPLSKDHLDIYARCLLPIEEACVFLVAQDEEEEEISESEQRMRDIESEMIAVNEKLDAFIENVLVLLQRR